FTDPSSEPLSKQIVTRARTLRKSLPLTFTRLTPSARLPKRPTHHRNRLSNSCRPSSVANKKSGLSSEVGFGAGSASTARRSAVFTSGKDFGADAPSEVVADAAAGLLPPDFVANWTPVAPRPPSASGKAVCQRQPTGRRLGSRGTDQGPITPT